MTEDTERALCVARYMQALNAGDLEGVLATFLDDATVTLAGAETVRGRDEISDFYASHFAQHRFGRVLHVDDVEVRADLAVVRSHTTGTITPLATASPVELVSRELFVLLHRSGEWRIQHYTANQLGPLPG